MRNNKIQIKTNPEVDTVFENYPADAKEKVQALRQLVIETAQEMAEVTTLEETLKWGEPSYRSNIGSTIRMDWKAKAPHQYALYFQCSSRLVETYRMLFNNTFQYEGKRALVFEMDDALPIAELKLCLKAALCYHKVKHLPTLGI